MRIGDGFGVDVVSDLLEGFGVDTFGIEDFAIFGDHIADWEHVDVITSENRNRVIAVTNFQHIGQYTQPAEHIDMKNGQHVVYAGQVSHGSFHKPFDSDELFGIPDGILPGEPCVYFGDPHNGGQTRTGGIPRTVSSVSPVTRSPGWLRTDALSKLPSTGLGRPI
ncbi:MAG: Vps62-related protein [Planctomycetota bacterium]